MKVYTIFMKPHLPLALLISLLALQSISAADIDINGGTVNGAILTATDNKVTNTSTTGGTLTGVLQLDADAQIGGVGNITLTGSIQGAHTLTKVDTNTVIINSVNALHTGTVPTKFIIDAGQVTFQSNNVFGGSGVNVDGIPEVTLNAGATLHASGFNIIGNIVLNGGTLSQDSRDVGGGGGNYHGWEFLGNVNVTDNTTISSVGNKVNTMGGGSHTFTVASGKTLTMTAGLHNGSNDNPGAAQFIKDGAGSILISNKDTVYSFSGGTTIKQGRLALDLSSKIGSDSGWSFGTGTITIENGGELYLHLSQNSTVTMSNSFVLNEGSKINTEDGRYVVQNVEVHGGTTGAVIGIKYDKAFTINGVLSGDGLLKFNAITDPYASQRSWTLNNDGNTFSGTIQLGGSHLSVLELKQNGAAKNATIDLQGTSAGSLTTLSVNTANATVKGLNGTQFSKVKATGGTRTLTVDGGGTFAGSLDASLNLVKKGTETLSLSGDSAGFNGTVSIEGGTLSVSHANALGAWTRMDLSGGATLSFAGVNGSVGAGQIFGVGQTGGSITGNFALDGGGINWILGSTPSASTALLTMTGGTFSTLANSTFNFTLADNVLSNGLYWLVSSADASGFDLSKITVQGILDGGRQTYTLTKNGTNNDIYLQVTGEALHLAWAQGSGTWSSDQTNQPWNDGTGANYFANGDLVTFGDVAGNTSSTITLDGTLNPGKVTVSGTGTNYIFSGTGSISGGAVLVKEGTGTLTITNANAYTGGTQLNGGTIIAENAQALGSGAVTGAGSLTINWGATDIGALNLTGHSGVLTLQQGGLRISTAAFPGASSVIMKGGSLYLSDAAGDITFTRPSGLVVEGTGSKIVRDNTGNLTWNTALTGGGTLSVELAGNGSLTINSGFNNSTGTLTANGNIIIGGTVTTGDNTGIILAEGKNLNVGFAQLTGTGTTTLSKNSSVTFNNGKLIQSSIKLDAVGGSVTFQDFVFGNNNEINGKITGAADQVIFNHNNYANLMYHTNWLGSDYVGTTIFKTTGTSSSGEVRSHIYTIAEGTTGAITPWGASSNLVQIGSADSKETLVVRFSGLGADKEVTIANNIELITGSVAARNSSLEFTSGSYVLSGDVKITNGGAENKAILKSSGANIELSGGLSGAGPLDVDMATGKTLLLSGDASYSGTVNVTNGIFSLGANMASGTVNVGQNGFLAATAGSQRTVSSVSLAGGLTVGSGAQLTATGSFGLSGTASLSFGMSSGYQTSLTVGSLTGSGEYNVTLNDLASISNTLGEYLIISSGSLASGLSFNWANRLENDDQFNYNLVYDQSKGGLVFSVSEATDVWKWNGTSSTWNNADGNWTSPGGSYEGHTVRFDDTAFDSAGFTGSVVIAAGGVIPSSVSVDNSEGHDYTFSGGSINNPADKSVSLSKKGTGVLTLLNTNAYSGGTKIDGGELRANAVHALGTGSITLTSGTLVLGNSGALSSVDGENTLLFNGGALKYGTGITTDVSGKIGDASNGSVIIDTNGNNVVWGTAKTAFAYEKRGTGSLTLAAGAYAGNMAIKAGTLAFGSGDVTLSGLLTGEAGGVLRFAANDSNVTISGDTSGYAGSLNASSATLTLVNGAMQGLTSARATISDATKVSLSLNADRQGDWDYSYLKKVESIAMTGGVQGLTFSDGTTINSFTQYGVGSTLTLNGGGMTFGSMKIGTQTPANIHDLGGGTLTIAGKVTTESFQGAVASNSRYTLNLQDGAELTVTGSNSSADDKGNASMVLSFKGFGEATNLNDVTTFNMTGGKLSVENATMFFAGDGHVVWNMSGGTAKLKGLDMTNYIEGGLFKSSKLFLSGGVLDIGANGMAVSTNSSQYVIELGDATLGAYESWTSASMANMSLTDATNGSKIRVDANASIELGGVISDKTGINGKLVKTGDGILTLSGTNTYSGGTSIEGGTVIVGAGHVTALGIGKVSVKGGTLNMSGEALGNELALSGASNLQHAQAYAGADRSVILSDMYGSLTLGNIGAGKVASISTTIVAPDKGTTISNIGSVGASSTLTLGNSSLAVGANNLFASVDDPYPGSAVAILQFAHADGSSVVLDAGATLTLDLMDADLIAKMQEKGVGEQTYQLLITNGVLGMGKDAVTIAGLSGFDILGIDGGNVIVSGDTSDIYAVASNQTKTLSSNDALDVFKHVLVNGTLNLNLPGVTAQADGLMVENLAGKATGVINITQNGGTGVPTLTLNVDDASANSVYNGVINGTNASLYKDGAGTQTLGGGVNLADGSVNVLAGKLVLGKTSTVGVIEAGAGELSLASGSVLNLLKAGSSLSGDAILSGSGTLNLKGAATLVLEDQAKLNGIAVNLEGGSLNINGTTGNKISSLIGSGTLGMAAGDLTIETKANATSVFTGTLNGTGALTVGGQGVQELVGSGNAGYSLATTGGTLIIRGDATTHKANYESLNIGSGSVSTIGTIGTEEKSPMTRLTLANGGTINSGGTLRFIYNTNLDDSLTSGPLLTTGGALDIKTGSTIDLQSLDDNLTLPSGFSGDSINMVITDTTGTGSITLERGVHLVTGGLFDVAFENTALELDANGNLVLTGTVRRDNLFDAAVNSANTASASSLLWSNRYGLTNKTELGKLVAFVSKSITSGNASAATRAMAASVGSTVTSLHAAQKSDFYKQQMWIRNRVAQMGVNPEYINEDMPYFNAWMQANSSYDKLNTSGDESGYKLTTWGGTVGFDLDLSEAWTIGSAFTASYGNLTANAADTAKGDFDSYYANLFARLQKGKWSHSVIVSGGWNDMTLNRNVAYGEGGYSTRGTTNGSSYGAMYEATYDISLNQKKNSILQPLFNASIQQSKVDGYNETGAGDAGLHVNNMDSTTGTIGFGARLMGTGGSNLFGREVLGELRAMVVQNVGDDISTANVGFMHNPGLNARVRGAKVGSTGAQLGGGLSIPVGVKGSVYVDVNADLRSGATSVNGNIGYRYNF